MRASHAHALHRVCQRHMATKTSFAPRPLHAGLFPVQRRFVSNRCDLDRAAYQRKDPGWLRTQESHPLARFLPFHQLKVLVPKPLTAAPEASLKWLGRQEMGARKPHEAGGQSLVLLGLKENIPHFAVDVSKAPADDFKEHGIFEEVRNMLMRVGSQCDIEIMSKGRSYIDWHRTHNFCSNCGHETIPTEGGFKRSCTNKSCGAEHYPRINPVAIVLVVRENQCLLGRQPRFPPGVYSCLAGFVETGESLEDCVRREVFEETGVRVGKLRYHSSQAWPFPSQLMLGCIAEADSDCISVDNDELEDARWIERSAVISAIERSSDFRTKDFRIPPSIAIAHHLIKAWAVDGFAPSE